MSKFSVLIANYNNGHFFEKCCQSLVAQTETNWEAVILDDGSIDDSLEVIKKIIGNDSRFKIHQNDQNRGIGYTKKRLIDIAESEICGFLDPDDALAPHALEIVLKTHSEYPEAGLVYSNFVRCDENLNPLSVHKAKQITELNQSYFNFNAEISHFVTFKKKIYEKTSGIDPFLKIAEDKDWYMKMCETAPVKYIDEDLYLYRIHDSGISTTKNAEKALFWHWVALIKMAERRNISVEDLFLQSYVPKKKYDQALNQLNHVKNSRWAKLGNTLGLFKIFKKI
ncbi:glycosyltransferase involved in cell wall biosynthesis [Chryseobacterium sediminis]|uniref:Glycosyltransferase involved in cell wall biosynthesis n=1 Tax=Chryseobacterium sediminis TaxID=1679494 RepID=A0ABR6Q2Q0_9FLAO|nr:glycosyltransferase [Chryseobacterium sediminis]MBB6332255.1 glycosyltransferase involved in cell wall biosynthesis [Chryseobacterium sediminis]